MGKEKRRYISYCRVSTQRQGRSGLGLEAQRRAVLDYLNGNGWEVIEEHVEVESGKRDDNRPELAKALAACRLHGATLVIARIDRLSRDAAFLLGLQKAGVPFVAADMPEANEMVVGIMAVVAQAERKMISERTKAALAAAKARGVRLGRPENLTPEGRLLGSRRGNEARSAKAAARARDLAPVIDEVRAAGTTSLHGIAAALNDRGVPAPRGGRWQAAQVRRVFALAPDLEGESR